MKTPCGRRFCDICRREMSDYEPNVRTSQGHDFCISCIQARMKVRD